MFMFCSMMFVIVRMLLNLMSVLNVITLIGWWVCSLLFGFALLFIVVNRILLWFGFVDVGLLCDFVMLFLVLLI